MLIKQDIFNSEIFGIKMGNIILTEEDLNNDSFDVESVILEGKRNGFAHLSVKIPTPYKKIFNSFIFSGFYLTDTLIEYVLKYDEKPLPPMKHKMILRDFVESDIESLMEIAKGSFTFDRYHSDPFLDNNLCDKYYEQWLYNSCHGFADKIVVAEYNNEVVGFSTANADHSQELGHMVLSAVSSKYRGLGTYTSMEYELIKWLKEEGFKGALLGTQINNVAVQKTWIKLGFTVLDSEYVLHMPLV